MPGDPKECRENAECCRRLADEAITEEAKETFSQLEHTWLRLAHDLEAAELLLKHWGDAKVKAPDSEKNETAAPATPQVAERLDGFREVIESPLSPMDEAGRIASNIAKLPAR